MKVCEYIDYCLSILGVDKVFGIPGSLIMPVWQNLKDKEIILCSHEQEASYVATGYAKVSGKPVCVVTTGGPGVTNCISGIASANIDSVPLIYISGRSPIKKRGVGDRQEESNINRLYDSVEILEGITKRSVCIYNIENAAKVIWETMKTAVEQRKGAVHISIPIDLQFEEISIDGIDFQIIDPKVDVEVFKMSERPIFVIGWGAWMSGSYTAIYELAERINTPVLVSSKAYCCINQKSKMYLGKLGYGYNSVIDDFIRDYQPDSIISFGSSLGMKDIKDTVLLHFIDEVPTYVIADDCEYTSYRNQHIIPVEIQDMRGFVRKIFESVTEESYDDVLFNKIIIAREKSLDYWNKKILSSDFMASCIKKINNSYSDDCVFFSDAGNNLANSGALITPANPGQMFLDVGLRAMGTGICTAVGMAINNRNKIYIAITGDGCMLMNGNVMHIAREMDLPIVFIVFNNQSLGRVRVGQSTMNDYRGTDIKNVDYVLYAQTFGVNAFRCNSLSSFDEVLCSCINSKKTCLIEVITDKDEVPVSVKDNIY